MPNVALPSTGNMEKHCVESWTAAPPPARSERDRRCRANPLGHGPCPRRRFRRRGCHLHELGDTHPCADRRCTPGLGGRERRCASPANRGSRSCRCPGCRCCSGVVHSGGSGVVRGRGCLLGCGCGCPRRTGVDCTRDQRCRGSRPRYAENEVRPRGRQPMARIRAASGAGADPALGRPRLGDDGDRELSWREDGRGVDTRSGRHGRSSRGNGGKAQQGGGPGPGR